MVNNLPAHAKWLASQQRWLRTGGRFVTRSAFSSDQLGSCHSLRSCSVQGASVIFVSLRTRALRACADLRSRLLSAWRPAVFVCQIVRRRNAQCSLNRVQWSRFIILFWLLFLLSRQWRTGAYAGIVTGEGPTHFIWGGAIFKFPFDLLKLYPKQRNSTQRI